MGPDGLRRATAVAILSANYIAARLGDHYPVLYAGEHGRVAHECIIDLRGITRATGVTVDDVAKRLIDYGFHAPTMSFPVAGTLMIEPTESESLAEIDRFCDAMIAIKGEIDRVALGRVAARRQPARATPPTPPRTCWSPTGTAPTAASWPRTRCPACGTASTGLRSAASTAVTATATWCAPARPLRRSRPDGCGVAGPRARAPLPAR